MARITEEQKVQINELYYVNHNKAQTARELGISASSVTKYLIPDYVPIAKRTPVQPFNKTPEGCQDFIEYALWGKLNEILTLNESEKIELDKLLKQGI